MTHLHFGKATAPPKLARPALWMVPFALVLLNGGMALAQLASFEALVHVIESYGFASGGGAMALAIGITGIEILSLPVLLRLMLSPAMRAVSTVAVIIAPLTWLLLVLWALTNNLQLVNYGSFGAFLPQPLSWWMLLEGAAILGLSVLALQVLGGKRLIRS